MRRPLLTAGGSRKGLKTAPRGSPTQEEHSLAACALALVFSSLMPTSSIDEGAGSSITARYRSVLRGLLPHMLTNACYHSCFPQSCYHTC